MTKMYGSAERGKQPTQCFIGIKSKMFSKVRQNLGLWVAAFQVCISIEMADHETLP